MYKDNLAFEADKAGMIHVRKHPGQTTVLPGYGRTNFGVSPFEEKTPDLTGLAVAAGAIAGGLLLWANRARIASGLEVLSLYALFLREERMLH